MLNLLRQAMVFVMVCVAFMHTMPAHALGLGGLNTKSYIGQPLLVEIPLYNVVSPNDIKVDLARADGESIRGLSAEISRANSQLSILIRSDSIVNEPYFNFELHLDDQGNKFTKQLTVLLNLEPGSQSTRTTPAVPASSSRTGSVRSRSSSRNGLLSIGDIDAAIGDIDAGIGYSELMGPYDWAQAGAIPEKFGAVLDGQSLWRVARRISPAMNVTNNQMMWALYQANPQAFATNSIESLQAGVFLNIPKEQAVRQVSDSQAKLFLADLSSYSIPSTSTAPVDGVSSNDPIDDSNLDGAEEDVDSAESELSDAQASESEQFQLTGLDKRVSTTGSLSGGSTDDGSSEIIGSLAETISSMTEQLGRKDKRIEVLEAQVEELQAFIKEDQNLATNRDLKLTQPSAAALEVSTPQLAEQERRLFSINKTLVPWIIGLILVIVGWLMRHRFVRFWQTLDFSRDNDRVEFQASEVEEPSVVSAARVARAAGEHYGNQNLRSPNFDKPNGFKPDLVEEESEEIEVATEGQISFQSSESEFSHSEFSLAEYSEVSLAEEYFDGAGAEVSGDQAASFEERFAQLIAEGNSVLARQLLDIAQGNQVASDRYHFHRLQLLSLEKEEDPFYEYYSEMENELPSFSSAVQTDISKLVVKMSQRDQ